MTSKTPTRRDVVARAGVTLAGLSLAGCEPLSNLPGVRTVLDKAEDVTRSSQRFLLGSNQLAREFGEADISPDFKANGTTAPEDDDYLKLVDGQFADYVLKVDGLVENPQALNLAALRGLPSRTQITRHDCVEGWSSIAKWTGVPLGLVLDRARLKAEARYLMFWCFDTMENSLEGPVKYYESIAIEDAYHPQTILAYDMNGKDLPIAYGAPLRLRIERQLGYKMAKYVMRIEAVAGFDTFGQGNGGYWEDRGYEWYAGI